MLPPPLLPSRVLRPVLAAAAGAGLWWAVVAALDISPFFLPAPPDVVDAFARRGPYLLSQAWITVGHTTAGFGIATAAGIGTALLLAASHWLREAVLPLLVALQAVPKVALAPLLIVWLGFGASAKITLVSLLCFFPVLVASLTGLTTTPAELTDLARSLVASPWQTFRKVRIPYALPQIFVGLKLAVTMALIGAVVAQITTPNAGLGAVIVRSGQSADTPLAFAAIVLLAGIGITGFYGVAAVERLVLPWARAITS